jgi:HK97 family phage major capsid protein
LKQERHTLVESLGKLVGSTENSSMTADESAQYSALNARIHELTGKILAIEAEAERSAEPRNRGPLQPGEFRTLSREEKFSDLFPVSGEQRKEQLDIGKFVRGLATGNWDNAAAERRAMSEGTSTAGGVMVPAPIANLLIDLSRAASVTLAAGVQTVPMDSSTLKFARVTADPTVSWLDELAPASVSAPSFDGVTLTAKRVTAVVQASNELIQDAPNASQVISHLLSAALASAIDGAVLSGTGTSGQPTGIKNASGVQSISMGANGAAPTGFSQIVQALGMIGNANVDLSQASMIWNPTTFAAYEGLEDANNNARIAPASVRNLRKFMTTALPNNEVQGSANTASSLIVGDFSAALLGVRQQISIAVSNSGYDGAGETFLKNAVLIRVTARVDVGVKRANHFVVVKGILPAA